MIVTYYAPISGTNKKLTSDFEEKLCNILNKWDGFEESFF